MLSIIPFDAFSESVLSGTQAIGTDAYKYALLADAPSAESDEVYADLSGEISYANLTGSQSVSLSLSRTGAETSIDIAEVSDSATGDVGPFRYVVIYNDEGSKPLVGYFDLGGMKLMGSGNTFAIEAGSLISLEF